ncbi:uncharacterized protein LOC142492403 [Ascaphus truei]|uniref:uncharacterized protein LOC142492403 n=1 Tax=Ascaphus truei TaxID=8439 RepID=UPI003F5AD012
MEPAGTTLHKEKKTKMTKKEKHTAPPEMVPSSQETDGGGPAATSSSGSGDVATPSGLTPTASTSSGGPSSNPGAGSSSNRRIPRLEPWMRQTVVMQLREVDGQRPLLDAETFAKELVSKAGFTPDEILSIQDLRGGLFFITFATAGACRRYWEAFQTLKQEVPFSEFDVNCPIQRDEKRITVTVRNPHIPGKDIATFLRRSCTVVKEPSRIKDKLGYWVGKWSMVVRLWPNPEAADRLHHLPPSFSLAGSSGRIFYPDQPQTCGNCGNLGHQWKQCTLKACRNCKNTGHETKDCPRQKTCDLCGETTHMFRDCQLRVRSYAEAAAKGATPGAPLTATQKAAKKPPANQPVKAQGGKYQKEQREKEATQAAPAAAPEPAAPSVAAPTPPLPTLTPAATLPPTPTAAATPTLPPTPTLPAHPPPLAPSSQPSTAAPPTLHEAAAPPSVTPLPSPEAVAPPPSSSLATDTAPIAQTGTEKQGIKRRAPETDSPHQGLEQKRAQMQIGDSPTSSDADSDLESDLEEEEIRDAGGSHCRGAGGHFRTAT